MIKQVNLEDVCKIIAGQSPPSSSYNKSEEGLPFFQGKTDFGKVHPKIRMWCSEPKKVSEPDDILISVRAPVGPTNINNVTACIGRGLSAIRCLDKIEHRFLLHFLRYNEQKIADKGTGSTFKAITQKELKGLKIPLPPLAEQKKIAAILDAADRLRQKDAQLIVKYNELSQALFLDMFGDPVTNPMGWNKKPLEQIGKISTGSTPPSSKENMFGGNIPFVTPSDLDTNKLYKRYVTKSGSDNSRTVNANALLVCCIGATIGKIRMVKFFCAFNQQINAIQWGNKINPYFGFYSFFFLKHEVIGRAISTTLPILKKSEFSKVKCTLPPISLQNQFAERIQHIEAQKQQAEAALQKSDDLFHSLLQRAFKGELTC